MRGMAGFVLLGSGRSVAAGEALDAAQQRGVVEAAVADGRAEATSWATSAPSGMTTPASRAAAVTMPMSLWCRSIRKPGSKDAVEHVLLLLVQHVGAGQPAAEDLRGRPRCRRRTPPGRSRPRRRTWMLAATISWLAALTVCPEPFGPTWTTVLPTTSRSGLAAAKSSAVAADHDRQRGVRSRPPRRRRPGRRAAGSPRPACSASCCVTSGRMLEKSMISVPVSACCEDTVLAGEHVLDVGGVRHHHGDRRRRP